MGASITLAGESLISQKQSKREALLVSKFVLANVPGLDTTLPVDRAAGLPLAENIVHSVPVTREGYLATNKVVYSLMLGSDIGDFDFNWIGLVSAEDVLVIAAYVPRQQKRKEIPPLQAGNNLTRNIILEYDGAQSLTGINVPASSWQFDFTADFTAINAKIELLQVEIAKKVDLETWTPPAAVSLDGPVLVYPGSTNTYKITDYNRFSVFTASTSLGTVSVAADVVTLVVPAVAAAGLLTLDVLRDGNKASFKLPVGAASIVPPTITSPANLATGVALDLVLTATPFEVFPAGYDHQVSRRWQISTDQAFTQVVFDKTSTTDLISIRPSDYEYFLPPGKRLYARAWDIGATMQSAAPVPTAFNTATTYIRRPSLIAPLDGQTGVRASVTLLADAFSVYGGADVHALSRFQIALANDGTSIVQDSGWSALSLTAYKPESNLASNTQFYARVKFRGQTLGETEWSPFVQFQTALQLAGIYTSLTAGATPVMRHTALNIAGALYVLGGTAASGAAALWRYSLGGTWTQMTNSPVEFKNHTAVEIGGKMYVYGGDSTTALRTLYVYDPTTDKWSQLASCPVALSSPTSVAINGSVYVYGSVSGSGANILYAYSTSANAWSKLASNPSHTYVWDHAAAAIDGKMYVFGGYRNTPLDTLHVYDTKTNEWAQRASGPVALYDHSAVEIGGKIYVYGGRSTNSEPLKTLYMYEVDTNAWSQLNSGASPRTNHAAAQIDNNMYIFGGNSTYPSVTQLNDLWRVS